MNTTLVTESEEKLKNLLMRVKEESKKAGLKFSIKKTKIMASAPITSWQIERKKWKEWQILFSWAPKSLWMVTAAMKLKDPFSQKKNYGQPRQHIKKQRHHFAYKDLYSPSYGFSSSHVWMWELDHKEGWVPKNWCFWIVVLQKTLENPLGCKKVNPINSIGNQSWIFFGRTDAEAPILWPLDEKSRLTGKDPNAGKDWRQKEKGAKEDEIVR